LREPEKYEKKKEKSAGGVMKEAPGTRNTVLKKGNLDAEKKKRN